MKPTILQNIQKSKLIFIISYLISFIKCCEVGLYLDFDGSCKNQCTGTTPSDNCINNDCQQMLSTSCISCLDGYYKSNSKCIICNSQNNCSTCINDSTCLTCSNNLYLQSGLCVATCGNGYYQNTSTKQCEQCDSLKNCFACVDNFNTCSKCNSNYYLDIDTCVSDCPQGKYKKLGLCVTSCGSGYYLNGNNECKPCNSNLNCESCANEGTSCLTCNESSQFKYKLNEKCVDDCGIGNYLDSDDNKICKQCTQNLNCSQCKNSTSCSACISNFFLKNSSLCVQDCGDGYFKDDLTKTCKQCNISKNCETCQDNNTCLTCPQSISFKFLMPDGCVDQCGSGYYNSSPSNICLKCDIEKNCKTCSSNGTTCDSCEESSQFKYMKNNVCVSSCGDAYFPDGSNCLPCNINCKKCSYPNTCDTCIENKFQKNGVCVDNCGEGYFANDYKECQRCTKNLNCKTCLDNNTCQTCDTGSSFPSFYENKCLASCPPGFYGDNNICKQCLKDLNCLTCNNSGQTCISCITDQQNVPQKFLINGKCDIQCGDGYYTDLGQYICKPCINGGNCQTCVNSTSCQTCNSGSTYKFMKNNLCVNDCGDGQYGDATNQCISCNSSLNCLTCSNGISCSSCDQNGLMKYKKNGSCVSSCGDRFYNDGSNNCLPCLDINCLSCQNNGQCTQCDQSSSFKFLRQNACSTSCGDQFYPTNFNICSPCEPSMNCKTCNDLSSCLSCYTNQNNAYLKDGKCQTSCSLSQYADDNKVCINCNPAFNCATCTSSGCESCEKSSQFPYLQTNKCVSACSEGYFLDSTKAFCSICSSHLNCKTCTPDGGRCQSCSLLSPFRYLQDGICVSSCSDNYFPDINNNNNCTQCNSSLYCKTCSNSNSCTSCDQSGLYKYLNGGMCVAQCDFGQFPENYQCKKCQSNCKTCLISSECTSCDDNLFLKDSQCVDGCGDGYQLVNGKVCQPCQSDRYCKTCSQSTTMCDSCYQEANTYTGNQLRKYLFNGQCITSCNSVGFPNEKNECISCPKYCQSCTKPNVCDVCQQLAQRSDEGLCILCNPGEIVTEDSKKCISHALCTKNPEYVVNKDDNMCIKKTSCLNNSIAYIKQIGNYYQCGTCFSPYFISSDRTQCIKQCPAGEIQSDVNSILCTRCVPPLIASAEKSQCIEPSLCTSPYIISLDSLQCIPRQLCFTQDNTYIYKDDSTSPPSEFCKVCQNSVISNNKLECQDSCPSKQFQAYGKKTCQLCNNPNQKQCSCSKFIDNNDNCVDQCPQMYFIDPTYSTKQCTFCSDVLTYDQKQCVKTCPVGQFLNSPISFICIPCNSYVSQNGYSCVQQCSKITDIDNKKCIQEQIYCPSLLSANGSICSKFCINGEVEIQNQQQCATKCPPNFIRDIRNGQNTCIPTSLCIGAKSSDQEKCIIKCSDIFEVQSETSSCQKTCQNNQIKVITNDLQTKCIDNEDNQYLNNMNNSLLNFVKIIQNKQVISDEFKEAYFNELQQYINKIDDIVKMELNSNQNGMKISQSIFSSIQNILQFITYQSYNNIEKQYTFSSSNFKISSKKLKSGETYNSNINLNQFLSSSSPILIQKITDLSKISDKIPSFTVAYMKQNIFCQEYCTDKYGYVSAQQYLPNALNLKESRVLESLIIPLDTFKITFQLDKNDNINSFTCVSYVNGIQQPSNLTQKDRSIHQITCTFVDNVYLINDDNCKYQDPANCKNNSEEAKYEEKIEDDSNLSSNQVIGIVIGIFVTLFLLAILGYMIYKRRSKKQKQTKYGDSNNSSKTNDLEQLQQNCDKTLQYQQQ